MSGLWQEFKTWLYNATHWYVKGDLDPYDWTRPGVPLPLWPEGSLGHVVTIAGYDANGTLLLVQTRWFSDPGGYHVALIEMSEFVGNGGRVHAHFRTESHYE